MDAATRRQRRDQVAKHVGGRFISFSGPELARVYVGEPQHMRALEVYNYRDTGIWCGTLARGFSPEVVLSVVGAVSCAAAEAFADFLNHPVEQPGIDQSVFCRVLKQTQFHASRSWDRVHRKKERAPVDALVTRR